MVKIDWKKNLLLAIPVTAAIWLIGFIFSKLSLGTVGQLYTSIPATSVITPTLGAKGLAILGGWVPQLPINMLPAIAILFISAFVTLTVGKLIVDGLFGGKTIKIGGEAGKIATYVLVGAIVGYLVFAGLKMPNKLTILGALIHTAAVGFISVILVNLADKVGIKI
jgi:hypothetical protein